MVNEKSVCFVITMSTSGPIWFVPSYRSSTAISHVVASFPLRISFTSSHIFSLLCGVLFLSPPAFSKNFTLIPPITGALWSMTPKKVRKNKNRNLPIFLHRSNANTPNLQPMEEKPFWSPFKGRYWCSKSRKREISPCFDEIGAFWSGTLERGQRVIYGWNFISRGQNTSLGFLLSHETTPIRFFI